MSDIPRWEPQAAAQAVVNDCIVELFAHCPEAANLGRRMLRETGTRFLDWIDFIAMPAGDKRAMRVRSSGFVTARTQEDAEILEHPGGLFPMIVLTGGDELQVGIRADSVSDCLAALHITNDHLIVGEPCSPLRKALVYRGDGASLWAVERHGSRLFDPQPCDPTRCVKALHHFECFRRRKRDWATEAQGWARVNELVDRAVADLGVDHAADLFFAAERDYWQRRNRAARVQKARQDLLGLGWANHDHHTYRSSREAFSSLVALLEKLGMICRERFYAGAEAGWGAQVLEQPNCRIVVFADVDLSPDEVAGDFSHEPLRPRDFLGTVGLWVGLHGESMLEAGMHHLECQFDHETLRDQLNAAGVEMMQPFTDLPYLRQAFTVGERWKVSEERIRRLVERGLITSAQGNDFRMQGAIGSHLENLQREDGFKGFNQKGVSDIIDRTDPRKQGELIGA